MPLRFASATSSPVVTDEVAAAASCVDDAARARLVLPLHRLAQRCRAAYDAAEARAVHAREAVASLLQVSPADLEPAAVAQRVQQAARRRSRRPGARPPRGRAARARRSPARPRGTPAGRRSRGRRARGQAEAEPRELEALRGRAGCWRGAVASRLPEAAQAVGRRRAPAGRGPQPARPAQRAGRGPARPQPLRRRTPSPQRGAAHAPAGPLDGMAAEMAGRLAVGGSCPVCGSDHHPRPATPAPDAPDAAAERALRRRIADAEVETVARADRASALETQAAVAEQAAGTDDTDLLDSRLAAARARSDHGPAGRQTASLAPRRPAGRAPRPVLAATTRTPDAADRPPRRARRVADSPAATARRCHRRARTRCSATTTPTWPRLLGHLDETLGALRHAERQHRHRPRRRDVRSTTPTRRSSRPRARPVSPPRTPRSPPSPPTSRWPRSGRPSTTTHDASPP